MEHGCPIGEFLLDLLSDLENDLGGVDPRPVVRVGVNVEAKGAVEGTHGSLRGIDGLVNGLASPLRRLAQGVTVVETVTDKNCVQRFTDIAVVLLQVDRLRCSAVISIIIIRTLPSEELYIKTNIVENCFRNI